PPRPLRQRSRMHPWRDPTRSADERVKELMAAMTLREKIAQLGAAWIGADTGGDVAPMQDVFAGGTDEQASLQHGIGHLTRVFGTEPVTAAEGRRILAERQRHLIENTRLGVPAIAHEECLTGFTTFGASVYPTSLAWAATFDPELIEEMAAASRGRWAKPRTWWVPSAPRTSAACSRRAWSPR